METELAPRQAEGMILEGRGVLIDVRTPAEYQEVHATHAVNLPLDALTREKLEQTTGPAQPIFICKSGARGKQALARAQSWGLSACNVAGGTLGWEASGCEVAKGVKVMSLERQVRIAAGSLVVLGTIVGLLLSPWGFGIPLFVGGGLVFAGITDTCGMAMILARMPWNQRTRAAG